MKWNRCPQKEDTSLLAGGLLEGDEKSAAKRHLSECPECRAYYDEIKALTSQLADWETDLHTVEPSAAMRHRWARSVESVQPAPERPLWGNVWSELVLPCRYIWSGLAVLWVAILVVHARLSDHQRGGFSLPQPQIIEAWREDNRVLAEWSYSVVPDSAPPPSILPPRSQKERTWIVI